MWRKRNICMVLVCMLMIRTFFTPVKATEYENSAQSVLTMPFGISRAIGSFSIIIPANSTTRSNSSFPMMAGETVTIKASYAPFSVSVDIGLIAPDGFFYYFTITNGSIDKSILIEDSGDYILQIKNNSSEEVEISGFVNY